MTDIARLVESLVPDVRVVVPPAPPPLRQYAADGLARVVYPRNFRPNTPQRRAKQILEKGGFRFFIVGAGRRGSKTQFDMATFADFVVRDIEHKTLGIGKWAGFPHPPWTPTEGKDPEPFLRYFVISPKHDLNDEPKIALRKYLGHVRDPVPGLIEHQHEKPDVWWLKPGVRFDFLSADTALNVSHGYDGGVMGEAAKCKATAWATLRPTLSDKLGWCLFDTTPEGHGWCWREIWARANREAAELVATLEGCSVEDVLDPEFGCYAWTTAENDALPHLAKEMEIARRQLPDAVFRREYLGSWDAFEGQCFDLQARHARKWLPGSRILRAWAGIDLGAVGKTSHRTSFTITVESLDHTFPEAETQSGVDVLPFGDDAWRRRDEGDASTWANRLYHALRRIVPGESWRRVPVFVPADGSIVKRVFEGYGFRVEDAFQEHQAAVTWIQVALKNDMVTIGSDVLWNCLVGIRYPPAGKSSTKLWVNENDDELDSFRYSLSQLIRDGEAPTRAPLSAMGWRVR